MPEAESGDAEKRVDAAGEVYEGIVSYLAAREKESGKITKKDIYTFLAAVRGLEDARAARHPEEAETNELFSEEKTRELQEMIETGTLSPYYRDVLERRISGFSGPNRTQRSQSVHSALTEGLALFPVETEE